ncbi:hypothetical protein TcWFU_000583 [Taenia crassiceps]|uniref:Uncharacterized protein n=1 Tax=Taenia crassiceps TaxID=6207 RepID=A0ABR4QJB0_9CEST
MGLLTPPDRDSLRVIPEEPSTFPLLCSDFKGLSNYDSMPNAVGLSPSIQHHPQFYSHGPVEKPDWSKLFSPGSRAFRANRLL